MISLQTRLQRLRRSFAAQIFVARFVDLALVGAFIWLVWAAAQFAMGGAIWNPWFAVTLVLTELCTAAAWAWLTRPDLIATAATMDRLANTRDRFTTALALSAPKNAVEARAAAECAAFLTTFDSRPWTRLRFPPRLAALLVPVIVTLLLGWIAKPPPLNGEEIAQRAVANERATTLKQLAQQAEHSGSPTAQRVAEQMKQAAIRIERAPNAAEADKVGLRAVSEIQAALQNQAIAMRQAEMDALAKALSTQPATKDAATAVQNRNLSEAADEMANAAKKLNAEAAKKLSAAMNQALQQLGSSSDSAISRQMNAMASGQTSASEALQKLAKMLQQQAGSRSAQTSGQSRSPTEQELLNALENLKHPSRGAQREVASLGPSAGPPKRGEGKSGARMMPSDALGKDQPGGALAGNIPSGQAGSEHDRGTTKDPFGTKNPAAQPASSQAQMEGVLGQGESLQSLVERAGGEGRSARRYRELYDAMAPAATQTVEQENIPAGSRYLIKRYFESIRPPE